MNHIFISYQRKSEKQVTELAVRLRAEGMDVWQDLSGKETGIPFSVKWWEVIRGALYGAMGAIVIKTWPWVKSKPCSAEYRLIRANRIPKLTIKDTEFRDMDALVQKIRNWYDTKVKTEENLKRTYLFTQAYRMEKDRNISHLLPGKIGFLSAWGQYRRFSNLEKYMKSEKLADNRPRLGKRMASFLGKAKRKIVREQAIRGLVILGGIAGIVMLIMVIQMLPNILRKTYESDYRGKDTAAFDMMADISGYDPVSTISLLTNDKVSKNFDPNRSFFFMQRIMAELLSRRYPTDFYAAGSMEAEAAKSLESPDYAVRYDSAAGTATITADGREITLMQDCAPQAYCYVPERNELIIASDRKIRAYDLDATAYPVALEYNFEEIRSVTAEGDRINGITVKGDVVCWNNPIPEKAVRRKLQRAALLRGGNAAYIGEEGLIIQRGGAENVCPVPFACSGAIAASADGRLIAAAGTNGEGKDCMALVDPESGETIRLWETPGAAFDMALTRDGKWLYAVTGSTLMRIDTLTGEAVSVQAEDKLYYTLAAYGDHLVAGRTDGMIAEFGSDLRRTGEWTEITVNQAPVKQLAVSESNGTAFAACRSGNTIAGCRRITLADGTVHHLALEAESGMISNNCVAVSEDGAFVAYGFPNGRVCVWTTDTLNELFEYRPAAEPLICLRFEGDGIYALGQSGTVYRTEFGGLVRKVEQGSVEEYWKAYTDKAVAIHRRMFELGLTYINP